MKRKDFLKKSLAAVILSVATPALIRSSNRIDKLEEDGFMTQRLGFNHLPNKEHKTMNTILHKSTTRGHANHGWLDSHHTFSFANYHNPERMHFGVLRVLNDDVVDPGQGFGKHPHDNMEIVSIPLHGDLEHQDSMGNKAVIKEGDIQVMSAGTGVFHSEYNRNKDKAVKFLQIWLIPKHKHVTPRYDQIALQEIEKENDFYQILSPNKEDEGVWIHQDAWFHLGKFTRETEVEYSVKKEGNGLYVFVIKGKAEVEGVDLEDRDGFGIWNTNKINFKPKAGSQLLLMEVPMEI